MWIALLLYLLRQKNFGRKGTVLAGAGQISAVLLYNSINARKTEAVSLSLGGLEAMLLCSFRSIRSRKIQVVSFHLHIDTDKSFFFGER